MTHKILMNTPFGFILELYGGTAYERHAPYELLVDGEPRFCGSSNITGVFGLTPGTAYQIEVKGLDGPLRFRHETEKAGYVIDVTDFGAAGDGSRDDTCAVNAAIYTAPAGSVVRFSKGVYTVGSVFLKSGVDIYMEQGAELRQMPKRDSLAVIKGYQKSYDHSKAVANASWEGNPLDCYASLLYGRDTENVRIYGSGVLNGSGAEGAWWENPKTKSIAWRPRNIFLAYCRNITVAGITSKNSAAWNIHPFYSDKLAFYCLELESDPESPNTDGLNPESCEDVEIAGCRFLVGDDCIAVKAGKIYMSRRHYKPCRRIMIRECLMEQGHGGVVIGSELSCGVQDVNVERCLFRGTDRGLRIKTRRGRGSTAIVDNIRFCDVEMDGVANCFTVNMYYNCDPDGHSEYVRGKAPLPVSDETPSVKNIHIIGVNARSVSGCAIFIYGLPESPVRGVRVENSRFSFMPDRPVACPAMMDDPILIPELGVFMKNVEDEQIKSTLFEGSYVSLIEEREEKHV